MSEHATIVRILSGRAKAGSESELVETMRPMVEWFGGQDGCFGAQVARLREESSVIAVISRWRDQASLDAALNSEDYRTRTAPGFALVEGEPTLHHYTSL
jgi:quinol monooxygenase YgiN